MDNANERHDSSLSFTSKIQQEPELPHVLAPEQRQLIPSNTTFEFHGATRLSSSPADILFSDGQLMPTTFQSFPMISGNSYAGHYQRLQSPSSSSTSSRSNSSSNTSGNGGERKKCLRENKGRRSVDSGLAAVPKRVTFQESQAAPRVSRQARDYTATPPAWRSKKKVEKRRGLFGSFMLVCRECHGLEPSKHVADKIVVS